MIRCIFTIYRHRKAHRSIFFIRCFGKIGCTVGEVRTICKLFYFLLCDKRLGTITKPRSTCSTGFVCLWMDPINRFFFVLWFYKFINAIFNDHRLEIVWSYRESDVLFWIIDSSSYIRSQLVSVCQRLHHYR